MLVLGGIGPYPATVPTVVVAMLARHLASQDHSRRYPFPRSYAIRVSHRFGITRVYEMTGRSLQEIEALLRPFFGCRLARSLMG